MGGLVVSVEVEVNLRPTGSRPVCLGVRRPSGTRDQFFFLLEVSFGQLHAYYFVAPSLTRGRVCNLLYICFWALPEQSLLGQSPAELTAIFYCLIWHSPNLEGQVPVFISPRNRAAQLYPRALGSLLSPLTLWIPWNSVVAALSHVMFSAYKFVSGRKVSQSNQLAVISDFGVCS
jgi:hypothetical protein